MAEFDRNRDQPTPEVKNNNGEISYTHTNVVGGERPKRKTHSLQKDGRKQRILHIYRRKTRLQRINSIYKHEQQWNFIEVVNLHLGSYQFQLRGELM